MRSIWSGTISFGLVNIPMKLYSATQDRRLDFDLLHKKDMYPVGYVRVCKSTGEKVAMEDIVKGYEFQKGDYVILTDEDFEKANVRKTNTIEIIDFVDEKDIDVVYFEKPYFIEAGKGADKTYVLLREALKKSKKVGVARFVLKTQEHLAVIKPVGDVLVLNQIRYAAELKKPDEIKIPKTEDVSKTEVEMALKLIEQLSSSFTPEKYHDTYTEELKETIEKKAEGKKIVTPKGEEAAKPTDVTDLMAALKQSLKYAEQNKPFAAVN